MPKKNNIGRALIKDRMKKAQIKDASRHTTEYDTHKPMSIIDTNDLDDYMTLAAMAKKTFEAERGVEVDETARLVNPQDRIIAFDIPEGRKYKPLKLPRKPQWTTEMTAEELRDAEYQAFLAWRRDLASMEEGTIEKAITPFEKNLAMWRELWRTIERSDVILQIVDGRNPLFFRSPDLEQYIREQGK